MNELALFAGAGGGILGGRILGWRTVCAVEIESYPQRVLGERQNDGSLEPFPIYPDIRDFDGTEWQGFVDVVSGGFPCQDISSAGKGAGIEGEKSGLWASMARVISEVEPRYVFVENSPMLAAGRGLGTVLGDLASMGFDAEWGVLGAHHCGGNHKRDRIWIVARHPNRKGQPACAVDAEMVGVSELVADASRIQPGRENKRTKRERARPSRKPERLADAHNAQRERNERTERIGAQHADTRGAGWWQSEPDVGRVAHGVASRVDRLRVIGNGQVPSVAALAFVTLAKRLSE